MTDAPDPSAVKRDVDRWGFAVALPAAASARPSPTAPPSPPRSRKPWVIAAVVASLLAAAVAITVAKIGGHRSPGPAPDTVVLTYLTDLSRGDADRALAQGPAPSNPVLLTDAVLRQQRSLAPLTAITVDPPHVESATAMVTAHYRLGSTAVTADYPLAKLVGRWQLTRTSFSIDISALGALPEPTLFGLPISGLARVQVFPGPLLWGSSNRFYAITQTTGTYPTSPTDPSPNLELRARLNAGGQKAVHSAIANYLTACSASHSKNPAGCPQHEDDPGVVDGSVHWVAPTKITGLHVTQSDPMTELQVQGRVVWRCTFRVRSGGSGSSQDIEAEVDGTVDLTRAVPVLTTGK